MGKDGGRRRAGRARLPRLAIAAHLVGIVLASVVWMLLVIAAIDFGEQARIDGDGGDWALLGVCAAAATACLVVALALGGRMLMLAGLVSDYIPKRAKRRG